MDGKYVIAKQEVVMRSGASLGTMWTVRRRWKYGLSRFPLCVAREWSRCVWYVNKVLAKRRALNERFPSRRLQ